MALSAGKAFIEVTPVPAGDFAGKLSSIGSSLTTKLTLPLVAAGVVAFQWAGQVESATNSANTAFGDNARQVIQWSDTSADRFGMAQGDALKYADQLGLVFESMGFGKAQAAGLAEGLFPVAANLAAFKDVPTAQVLDAITKAMLGQTRGLKTYGLAISAADVKAKEQAMGLDKIPGLSANAQRAIATQALIEEQAAVTKGQFAAKTKEAGESERIFMAHVKDLVATIGKDLLPIGKEVIGWLTGLFKGFQGLSPEVRKIVEIFILVAAAAGPVLMILGALASPVTLVVAAIALLVLAGIYVYQNWSTIWPAIQKIAQKVWDWINEHASFVVDAIKGIIAGVKYVADHWGEIWAGIQRTVAKVWDWIDANVMPVLSRLWKAFQVAMDRVDDIVRGAVAVLVWIWDNFGSEIVRYVKIAWDFITGIISAALSVIKGIIDLFIAIFTGDWGGAWDAIKEILGGVWDAMTQVVSTAIAAVKLAIDVVLTALGIAWGVAWDAIKLVLSTVWDAIKALVAAAIQAVSDSIHAVLDPLVAILQIVWDAVKAAWSAAWDALKGFVSGAVDGISDAVHSTLQAVADVAGSIWDAAKSAWDTVWGLMSGIVTGAIDTVKAAWNGFVGFWNGIKIHVPGIDIPLVGEVGNFDVTLPHLPKAHAGAYVMGTPGAEVLALLTAGERVFTGAQTNAMARALAGAGTSSPSSAGDAYTFTGDLTFPNVRNGDDAAAFLRNLQRLTKRPSGVKT